MKRKLNDEMSDNSDNATKAGTYELVGHINDDWVLVDAGSMKGMKIATDRNSGLVVSISTRQCPDSKRWSTMPSLAGYISLRNLDLHQSRYITSLHPSVCKLVDLETLILTRCERLTSLPSEIGNLTNLKERLLTSCSTVPWKAVKELPPSIGNLTSLVELSLSKCIGLSCIPPSIGNCQAIEDLILNKCKGLTELPDSLCGLSNVCMLDLRECVDLIVPKTVLPLKSIATGWDDERVE
eukprot:scaffold6124_cov122-Cylindrotheca_fusiformis.AAC.33